MFGHERASAHDTIGFFSATGSVFDGSSLKSVATFAIHHILPNDLDSVDGVSYDESGPAGNCAIYRSEMVNDPQALNPLPSNIITAVENHNLRNAGGMPEECRRNYAPHLGISDRSVAL
jgi:hypothetical protein